jgi:Domain of unknown function (DUF4372)/Transposase DDE domain
MYAGRTLFSQVMDFISWTSFDRIVAKYRGDVGVRTLRCTEHFRVMAFAQITYRESLRDIEACLGSQPSKLCGMGLREPIAKSTLADANERRNWRIWSDLAAVLIKRARKLYLQDDIGLDLANSVYALDSTTIDLCLSLFPWADFRSTKAGIKMHTLLDLRGPIASFIHVSDGKMGDALALDLIVPEAGAIYVMDRGYVDFRRLYVIHQAGAFFVTRTKINMKYHRVYSRVVDKTTGVISDHDRTRWFLFETGLPPILAAHLVSRSRDGKTSRIFDQQFFAVGCDDRRALQKALGSGIVFQMDQAESAHQAFLRHVGERGENANLDCRVRLCGRGHHKKGAGAWHPTLHFSTDFIRSLFRKKHNWIGSFLTTTTICRIQRQTTS